MKTVSLMSSRNCVPKRAVLKYNTCIENDRLKMIGALDEKHFHQNDRSKMIVGGKFCFQQKYIVDLLQRADFLVFEHSHGSNSLFVDNAYLY